jgi:hypothetical protein
MVRYAHITPLHFLNDCEHSVSVDEAIAEMQARVTLRMKQLELVFD